MTKEDWDFLRQMLAKGCIKSPCLEMGVGLEGTSAKTLLWQAGITRCYGTDLVDGPEVDFVVDFEAPRDVIHQAFAAVPSFGSILCFNVLEHTFEPIRILDNLFSLLEPGGTCILVTPARWPLHNYPIDCWRILPSFYTEYARRRRLRVLPDTFQYVGYGPVDAYRDGDGLRFPPPASSRLYRRYSHVIHRLFQTFGKDHWFAELVAIGVVIQNTPPD